MHNGPFHYRYFAPKGHEGSVRESETVKASDAYRVIGERAMAGWELRQAYVRGQDGKMRSAVWFLSADRQDRVWSLHISNGWE